MFDITCVNEPTNLIFAKHKGILIWILFSERYDSAHVFRYLWANLLEINIDLMKVDYPSHLINELIKIYYISIGHVYNSTHKSSYTSKGKALSKTNK